MNPTFFEMLSRVRNEEFMHQAEQERMARHAVLYRRDLRPFSRAWVYWFGANRAK